MKIENVGQLLQKVRAENPLVHNITNVVVTNFTANGLLALGASPVMAYAAEEVGDMAKIAGALVLNIGTLNSTVVESMLIAGKSANKHRVPVILDPVGAGATSYRTQTARKLMDQVQVSMIRGNAAEIANVAGHQSTIKGVDAGELQFDPIELAKAAAKKWKTAVVVTGKEDVVSDGERTFIIRNGDKALTKVTGTGCLLTSVIGAFAAVEKDLLKAAASALTYYGVAAEVAAKGTKGPGSFQIEFLNQLALVDSAEINQLGKLEEL